MNRRSPKILCSILENRLQSSTKYNLQECTLRTTRRSVVQKGTLQSLECNEDVGRLKSCALYWRTDCSLQQSTIFKSASAVPPKDQSLVQKGTLQSLECNEDVGRLKSCAL
ncbi:uncharacterized protein LOC143361100 [Halictus rubicundus]|uniref:uncharacterized protein LOC143361100 n=1 Tax=Halictus rubicundus TaxID=77578 RepID=UPI0040361346